PAPDAERAGANLLGQSRSCALDCRPPFPPTFCSGRLEGHFMATATTVPATGDQDIDGLLYGRKWTGTVTYSFPDSTSDYVPSSSVSVGLLGVGVDLSVYGGGELQAPDFAQVSAAQQQAVHDAMDQVESFTNLSIEYAGTDSADIRIAQSSVA